MKPFLRREVSAIPSETSEAPQGRCLWMLVRGFSFRAITDLRIAVLNVSLFVFKTQYLDFYL